ncbi:zinc-binding dehydrogenase [Actinoallomurus acaciae]|uniref:Zinc-binding dehydrogenase n=1 Tax=Actinoallomurus acaciae TaxID=502577 RepID=A0ABV5YMF8_9ACTN
MYEGRSWQATEFGEPEDVMSVVETRWSAPADGQILVRVRAVGAGFADVLQVRGQYPGVTPPVTPGLEVAGEVAEAAPGTGYAPGDMVMGVTPAAVGETYGGYADYTYLRAGKVRRIPSTFSAEEAAGFMIPFRTAHQALAERISTEPGETLAVLGAGGGVGSAAIQLGKALGLTVIAVAATDEKLKFCMAHGADHGVNHREQDVAAELVRLTDGAGVDVLLDTVGGELTSRAIQGVGSGGRVSVAGYASGAFVTVDVMDMVLRNYSVVGVYAGGTTPDQDAAAYGTMLGMAERGVIRTPIGTVSPFEEVPAVLARMASGGPAGKHIIRVS